MKTHCSACDAELSNLSNKIAGEYLCDECLLIHEDNLSEALSEQETVEDLRCSGLGIGS